MPRKTSAQSGEITVARKGQGKEIAERFFRNGAAVVGLVIVVVLAYFAVFPASITKYNPIEQDYTARLLAPSKDHLFGTDELGN